MDQELRELHASLGIPATYPKTTKLACYSAPAVLVSIGDDVYGRPQRLEQQAATAWFAMRDHAHSDGITLQVVSAYRSAEYQAEVIQRSLDKGDQIEQILQKIAAPGFSEHQSGRALDLTSPGFEAVEEEFEESKAFTWLTKYARQHGFELSYPRDNPYGVIYEPWHWCYRK
ncbi:MAG: M15 family metallopeptidase [Gammaproteobacteria bacterium]|nr:M15 family metallopeptidase [Gammaproteobacteria bacterium]